MDDPQVVRCPRCTRPNRAGARRCAGCGAPLPELAPRADAATEAGVSAQEPDENPELLYQHASSLMDLSDMGAAIPLFQRILAADPTNGPALEQLEAIFRSSERWVELTELLAAVAEQHPDAARRTELFERAATLTEQLLADPEGARALRERSRATKSTDEG